MVPLGLLVAYGLLRLSTTLFTEARELVFAKATEGATRHITLQVFEHLHRLSLRFHLARQTGGMTRDIERGTRSVQSLISYSLYSIIPTFIEVTFVLVILGTTFDASYVLITLTALVLYIAFTVVVTEWRTKFRRAMNAADSSAHSRAIDSLLNYETVKYFNNESFEAHRYNENLESLRQIRIKNQTTLSFLNAGQQLIIATALVLMLWRATAGVVAGTLTLGDLVMINAFMIQLYIPLGFLGVLYREIKQSLTDLDKMFVLMEREREIEDRPGATPLQLSAPPSVRFQQVDFSYEPNRQILHGVDLDIPAGKTVAVVGSSGSGKSTLARLLYRFYDVQGGALKIDGIDVRDLTQDSLRGHVGIVPQDTVLVPGHRGGRALAVPGRRRRNGPARPPEQVHSHEGPQQDERRHGVLAPADGGGLRRHPLLLLDVEVPPLLRAVRHAHAAPAVRRRAVRALHGRGRRHRRVRHRSRAREGRACPLLPLRARGGG